MMFGTEKQVQYSRLSRIFARRVAVFTCLFSLAVFTGSLAGTPALFAQTDTIVVRQGQHPDYSRIVIELPVGTTATVTSQGRLLQVGLSGRHNLDFTGLQTKPLVHIGNPRQAIVGGTTYAEFDIPTGATVTDARPGRLLVVNVRPGAGSTPIVQRTPPPVTMVARARSRARTAAAATDGEAQVADAGTEGAADDENADTENADETDDADEAPNVVIGEDTAPLEAKGPSQEESQESLVNALGASTSEETKRNLRVPQLGDSLSAKDDENTVKDVEGLDLTRRSPLRLSGMDQIDQEKPAIGVEVVSIENGLALKFDWPEDVAAAVFERGRYLWLVFDRAYRLDPEGLIEAEKLASRRIEAIEMEDHPDAMVLRLAVRPDQNYAVEKDDQTWIVALKDTPSEPRFPLRPTRRQIAEFGQQVFVQATDIGRKIVLEDPIVGDLLNVLPLQNEGRGLAEGYAYTVAELPVTAQGILVIARTDDVQVDRTLDGVGISTTSGNLFAENSAQRTLSVGALSSSRLIDFASWRDGEIYEFKGKQLQFEYALSVASPEDQNARRWDLARFYLAHGRASEAIGYLNLMRDNQPQLERDPVFRAVRGVTKARLRRFDEAYEDLSLPDLANEQDADLWRTLLATKLGRFEDALSYYRRGRDVIGTYDINDRADIQMAAIDSALEVGDFERALREIQLTEELPLDDRRVDQVTYQKARLYSDTGRLDEALDLLDQLALSRDNGISARATFTRLMMALNDGTIAVPTAIDQLERLRYVWRGDGLEIQIIDRLAELYAEVGRYEDSLEVMKTALAFLPNEAPRYNFSSRQRDLFKQLFLAGRADELRPLQAITLWFKYQELTPLGAEGNRMVRLLANRLVDVEAFDEAAELLNYQVQQQLEGAARAQVAANLAAIHITAGNPQEAMQVLRSTREPRLPEDIENNRRWVEARALLDLKQYEEAEVLLETDTSSEADQLRGDLYWAAKNWGRLVEVNRKLLGDGWRRNEQLEPTKRVQLIRLALALTFERDRAGLIELRRRYGQQMRTGSFAIAFAGLTSDQELTTKELGDIASSIANVNNYRNFLREYSGDFASSN